MAWFLIAIAAIVSLWSISLWRILSSTSASCIPSTPGFLASSQIGKKKRNVMLVIAHPDDESMFFTPTILFLNSEGHNIHILCISTGNVEGIGNTRKDELYRACAVLKIPLEQVKVLDNPSLQDGFSKPWDHHLLAGLIEDQIKVWNIDTIITFDNYGVSGHPNHSDVHYGICMLLQDNSKNNYEAWELVSKSIFHKYTGPCHVWSSILGSSFNPGVETCLLNRSPYKSYLAMAEHDSQWVWPCNIPLFVMRGYFICSVCSYIVYYYSSHLRFRKLFVLFSSYTYMNTLRKINLLPRQSIRS